MATQKRYFWYVVVFTSDGPKYVTRTDRNSAYWDETKPPVELGKSYAHSIISGLTWNGYNAVAVCSPVELEYQPYRYENGHFEFVKNSLNNKGGN